MRNYDVLALIIDAAKNDDMERVIKLTEELQDQFCDNNCTWLDHAAGCVRSETLRDDLASNACIGFLGLYEKIVPNTGVSKKDAIASLAYEMADAMLKARSL